MIKDPAVIIMPAVLWIYTIYCLLNGRKVKTVLANSGNLGIYLVEIAMIVIIFFKASFLTALGIGIFVAFGFGLLLSVPSGFSQDAIYVRGIGYPMARIKEVQTEKIRNKIKVSFDYRFRYFILYATEQKDVEELLYYVRKKGNQL